MIYLVTILFTLAFVFYSKYQFDDEKAGWEKSKGLWHPYGFIMRVLLFAALLVFRYFPFDWWDFGICAVLSIVIWDIGINVFALKVKWNYDGTTSETDKILKDKKWYIYIVFLIGSLVGKIFNKNKNKKL